MRKLIVSYRNVGRLAAKLAARRLQVISSIQTHPAYFEILVKTSR